MESEFVRTATLVKTDQMARELGSRWLLRQIRLGRLRAVSTSYNEKRPRYLIKLEDWEIFKQTLQ